MRKLFFSVFIASLATGCSSSVTEQKPWRGVYSEGFEVSAFTPCGGEKDFWLDAKQPQVMDDVEKAIKKIRAESGYMYPKVYIEIYGVDEGKANDGFAEDYDAVMSVEKVINFTTEIPYTCQH
ncbi:hypothetical protein [Aeromonas veronii]|uniref:hypothetical protein n=1 Tax=Aeromonas veronii TaxID=654 RepID=UPI003D25DC04